MFWGNSWAGCLGGCSQNAAGSLGGCSQPALAPLAPRPQPALFFEPVLARSGLPAAPAAAQLSGARLFGEPAAKEPVLPPSGQSSVSSVSPARACSAQKRGQSGSRAGCSRSQRGLGPGSPPSSQQHFGSRQPPRQPAQLLVLCLIIQLLHLIIK